MIRFLPNVFDISPEQDIMGVPFYQARGDSLMSDILSPRRKLTSAQIIILGFSGVILLGALILMLPISSAQGVVTPFGETLFTATSAVCVTGLVVHDTALYWSPFGQAVILLLIQVGGLGVVTAAVAVFTISGRRISLMQRSTMQEAISAPQVGGIVRATVFIVRCTLVLELLGAAAMAPVFCRDFGAKGLWMALFHSVSAFCNAGFDLMGEGGAYSSLVAYADDPVINVTVMLLIVVGGIGFLTWEDVRANRWHVRRYRLQSKMVLYTTGILLLVPAVYFFTREYAHLPMGQRLLASMFQAVTPRTAGFNTMDLTLLKDAGIFIMIALMLIGGSPGSTAGGMKTTTAAVMATAAWSVFRREEHAHLFGRRMDDKVVKQAATILVMYLALFFAGALVISVAEDLPMDVCLFETASAIGTVGLTLGLTPSLGWLARGILIFLMFFGRVGGLTLIFAAMSETNKAAARLPQEKITVG